LFSSILSRSPLSNTIPFTLRSLHRSHVGFTLLDRQLKDFPRQRRLCPVVPVLVNKFLAVSDRAVEILPGFIVVTNAP